MTDVKNKTDILLDTIPDFDNLLEHALSIGGETNWFDFKENLDLSNFEHKVKLIKAIGAFGNTDSGGYLIIGISDDRRIIGLEPEVYNQYDQTKIYKIVSSYLAPVPSLQVHQHSKDGYNIVFISIKGFSEIPSIVIKSATIGNRKCLIAGTILYRTQSAESAVLNNELDMRKLCDAIASRKANSIIELFHRGSYGIFSRGSESLFAKEQIVKLRSKADDFWPSYNGEHPYIEVSFAIEKNLFLSVDDIKSVIPGACVNTKHGFPFYSVGDDKSYGYKSYGLIGMIPYFKKCKPNYLWILTREGVFIDRVHLWEDNENSEIPNGIGIYHIASRLILLLHFIQKFARILKISRSQCFRLELIINNINGRYIENEYNPNIFEQSVISEDRVNIKITVSLNDIYENSESIVVTFLQEVALLFGKNWDRQFFNFVIKDVSCRYGDQAFCLVE